MTLVAFTNALHDGAMRTRFHADPIIQATELLLQERTPRDVVVARPPADEIKADATRARDYSAHDPPVSFAARSDSPHPSAVQRPVRRDDHGGRLGLQPLAGPGGHAMARGRHLRFAGALTSFCATRRAAKSGRPATSRAASKPDSYEVEFSEDRAEIIRRDGTITTTLEVAVSPEDDAEVRRVSISNLGTRTREIELTSYAEVVLAPRRRRRRASGLLQAVRADGVRSGRRRAAGHAAPALARRRRSVGGASRRGRGRSRGRGAIRDRPRALPRARARHPHADLGDRRPAALQYRRRRARSDLQPAPPRAHTRGRHRARRVLDDGRALARPRRSIWSTNITIPAPSSARSRSRGPRRRCSFITSASAPTKRISSNVSPTVCSTPTRRCGLRPTFCGAAKADRRRSGPTESPAICRSCWRGSTRPRIWRSSASCCAPTNIGG